MFEIWIFEIFKKQHKQTNRWILNFPSNASLGAIMTTLLPKNFDFKINRVENEFLKHRFFSDKTGNKFYCFNLIFFRNSELLFSYYKLKYPEIWRISFTIGCLWPLMNKCVAKWGILQQRKNPSPPPFSQEFGINKVMERPLKL